jgi:hypothetical protein
MRAGHLNDERGLDLVPRRALGSKSRVTSMLVIWAQISPSVLPSPPISRGARCQIRVARHAGGLEVDPGSSSLRPRHWRSVLQEISMSQSRRLSHRCRWAPFLRSLCSLF